tara:strand:- start:2728 stop:5712 length:2985 start_codon:yes stop_codon:yes gene_type:complete
MRWWISSTLLFCTLFSNVRAESPVDGDSHAALHDVAKLVQSSRATKPPLPFRPDALLLKSYSGDPSGRTSFHRGLLLRELVRQSLLISARDELGLRTRDATLRESLVDSDKPAAAQDTTKGSVQIVSSIPGDSFLQHSDRLEISIFRDDAPIPQTVFEKTVQLSHPRPEAIEEIAAAVEQLSRNEFPKVLREVGYQGNSNAILKNSSLPDDVVQSSSQWDLVSQFNAIRALHQIHRTSGESPQSLAALAESYARLGTLTAFLRSPAHQALKARALLYSHRLLARTSDSDDARQSYIYVLALLGRHQTALDQLDLLAEQKVDLTLPTEVIKAFVRFDADTLEKLAADPSQRSLVRYLQFLAVEPLEDHAFAAEAAMNLVKEQEACLPAYHFLSHRATLGVKRGATAAALGVFAQTLYDRLAQSAELPSSIRNITDRAAEAGLDNDAMRQEMGLRLQLINELHEAGQVRRDNGELSWDFLGQLIREVNFAQAADLLFVQGNHLGLPLNEMSALVSGLSPLISGHPYEQGLLGYGRTLDINVQQLPRFLESIDLDDMEVSLQPMAIYFADLYRPLADQVMIKGIDNQDLVYRDLVFQLQRGHASLGDTATFLLRSVSPKSPMYAVGHIRYRWGSLNGQQRSRLESDFENNSLVLENLTQQYLAAENWSDAERLLLRLIELYPTAKSFETLANLYGQQGKTKQWLETLSASLELPASGLDQDRIRVQIAEHYMSRGEFAEALPYAEQAAQSWAAWAMIAAINCHEALGDNEAAELWVQRLSQRYDSKSLDWYFFCRRTGSGNVEQAFAFAKRYLQSIGEPLEGHQQTLAVLDQLQGNTAQAALRFQRLYDSGANPWDGLHAAMLATELGETEAARRLLVRVAAQKDAPPAGHEVEATLAQLLLDSQTEPSPAFDRDKVDALVRTAPPGDPTNLNYFIGKFLWHSGDRSLGEAYLRLAARSPTNKWNRHLAAAMLRDEAIDFGTPAPKELLPAENPSTD